MSKGPEAGELMAILERDQKGQGHTPRTQYSIVTISVLQ